MCMTAWATSCPPYRFAPKKMGAGYGAGIEIAAVASLLRNDIRGVFLPEAGREAAAGLAMTGNMVVRAVGKSR
ncbi:MAG: hypothetical protein ACYSWO_25410 [Planctomycetota bacterium]